MKAERRHELKENDLVHALHVARDYLDENGRQIGIAILVVGVIAVVVALGVRSRAAAIEDVWRRKTQLKFEQVEAGRESIKALATLSREVSDPTFVFACLVEQGAQALRLAQEAPTPPDRALTHAAREAYEELLRRFGDNPLAVGLARSGLASVEENLYVVDGNPDHKPRAAEQLQAISSDPRLDGLPFKRLAMERLARLDDTFARVIYGSPKEPPAAPETPPLVPSAQLFVDPADAAGANEPADDGVDKVDDPEKPQGDAKAPGSTPPAQP